MSERQPVILIYTGPGTSHSWLWAVESLFRMGFVNLVLSDVLSEEILFSSDVLLISGGDTIYIADSLDLEGAKGLRNFIKRGGLYIGSCAGAYLFLKSSLGKLKYFNFLKAPIANLRKNIPEPLRMKEKYATEYGTCRYVFHPVRGEMLIRKSSDGKTIKVPIYGGPVMTETEDVEVLFTYSGFTKNTVFLTEREFAEEIYTGKVAGVRAKDKNTKIYLFGPHLEHPDYSEANHCLRNIIKRESKKEGEIKEFFSEVPSRNVRAIISNLRIALRAKANSLKGYLGGKYLMDYHFLTFVDEMWRRIRREKFIFAAPGEEEFVYKNTKRILEDLKNGRGLDAGEVLLTLTSTATRVINWWLRKNRIEVYARG